MKNNPDPTESWHMIARTKAGDPVWRIDGAGRPFVLVDGGVRELRWWWRWWPWWPSTLRHLPEPHLTYGQVATAAELSTTVLKALKRGPIFLSRGFLKGCDSKIITTRANAVPLFHWMEGCGIVLTRRELQDGRTEIDLDVKATAKNNVR